MFRVRDVWAFRLLKYLIILFCLFQIQKKGISNKTKQKNKNILYRHFFSYILVYFLCGTFVNDFWTCCNYNLLADFVDVQSLCILSTHCSVAPTSLGPYLLYVWVHSPVPFFYSIYIFILYLYRQHCFISEWTCSIVTCVNCLRAGWRRAWFRFLETWSAQWLTDWFCVGLRE